jgi:hypothetical protein
MRGRIFRRQTLTAMLVIVSCAALLLSAAWAPHAGAAQTAQVGGGNALKVSPVRLDLKLDPGVTQDISLIIENISDVTGRLKVTVNDFVAGSDESGRPNIILDENEFAPSHSLKRMIVPISPFTIGPRQKKEVKIPVSVPKNAAGGGYYAAVRFSPADTESDEMLSLSASVGTLVLLIVNGDIKEDLTIESFDVRKGGKPGAFFTNNKGLEGTVRFRNNGNVQVEPFGKMTLKRFGKVVASYEINQADIRGNVLPDSVRRFTEKLDKVQSWGKYTLEGNFGYGSTGQLLVGQTTFYVVPVFMLLIGIGALLLLLFLIFVLPRMIKAYNRRILRRANRRRY